MLEKLNNIYEKALKEIESTKDMDGLTSIRNVYLSKKSELMSFMGKMKDLKNEEKAAFGQFINNIKNEISEKIDFAFGSSDVNINPPGSVIHPVIAPSCIVINPYPSGTTILLPFVIIFA